MAHAIVNLRHGSVDAPPGWDVLDAEAVRQAFGRGRLRSAFRRYDKVELAVEDRRALLSPKPVLAARLLARGACAIVDREGVREALTWPRVAVILAAALRDRLLWPSVRRRVQVALETAAAPAPEPIVGTGPPLYLRTDLWYGLLAGGSVGHTAGVIKGLAAGGQAPVLAAPERVPTVPDDIAMLRLQPRERTWPVSDWQLLEFNLDGHDQVLAGWQGPPPRFVYHRHALYSFAGLALARHWGVPLVLEYNGPEVWVADHWGRPLAERSLAEAAERAALRGATLVAVVSEALRDDLVATGLDPARIAVVPNAVDTALYRPDIAAAELRARLGLGDRLVIGFIGTFGPWHGVELLVEAFARLLAADLLARDRLALVLVGDGARMAAVQAATTRHGLQGSVVTAGLVPQEAGPAHLACFDIAVAPTVANPDGSAFFGSPTKLFEYLAMGRPVVASAIGQVTDIVSDGETGLLVPPGDADALARALARLAGDPALRETLGTAARAEALARHGHEARAAALLAALDRALDLPHRQLDPPRRSV
ncbi:MAG: glycosyltransferase [Proteobacteria bacterium]|nr:glycosyltransferase [Pseudomonadota bacterium]